MASSPLRARVSSYAEQYAAFEAAERIIGVKVGETKVDLPSINATIRTLLGQALNALKRNVWVPRGAIRVKVNHGRVTTGGTVDYKYQQESAEDAGLNLVG